MWKYMTPEMEVMFFDDDVRTDVVNSSDQNIEPGDNNVDMIYPV